MKDMINSLKFNRDFIYKIDNTTLSAKEQLKFLIHFLQDFNQPLHLLGYDRGGNSFKVIVNDDGHNKTYGLHYVWDTLLPVYYIENFPYSSPLQRVILPEPFDINQVIAQTLNGNLQISCKIYPKTHYLVFNDYFKEENFQLLFDRKARL